MVAIRGSKSTRHNASVVSSKRKENENNQAWLNRHWPDDSESLLILLLGGATPTHFRLRVAQSTFRHDHSPSHWSHIALLAPTGKGKAKVWEASLEPKSGFGYPPQDNGLQVGSLQQYTDSKRFPNIALLKIGAKHADVLHKDRVRQFRNQRAVLDAVSLLHAWLGYAWGVGDHRNPLESDIGIPSAAVAEVLLGAQGMDLTPGVSARSSCPEAIWQSAKWWHLPDDADADLKLREMSGCYNIQDVIGCPTVRSEPTTKQGRGS
jgi:hypothetical protein